MNETRKCTTELRERGGRLKEIRDKACRADG